MTEEKIKTAIDIKKRLDSLRAFRQMAEEHRSKISISSYQIPGMLYLDEGYTHRFVNILNELIKNAENELNEL